MTLRPGDIISTGTLPCVGDGMHPPRYLKPGDIVELGVRGVGVALSRRFAGIRFMPDCPVRDSGVYARA